MAESAIVGRVLANRGSAIAPWIALAVVTGETPGATGMVGKGNEPLLPRFKEYLSGFSEISVALYAANSL